MDRWRGTLVQLACVVAVVVLGTTPSPDQTMKLLSLVIVGMIGGAAVTRSKLDALTQAVGGPSTPAGMALSSLAALTAPSLAPPPSPAPKIVVTPPTPRASLRERLQPYGEGALAGTIMAAVAVCIMLLVGMAVG